MSSETVRGEDKITTQEPAKRESSNGSQIQICYQAPVLRTVDDFIFDAKKIGEGTYGTVFKAIDKQTNETVALKQIRISQKDSGLPITAVREIKLLKSLINHTENIVTLKDVILETPSKRGDPDECIYLVFEYMDHDLSGLSKTEGHRFINGQICCYIRQLLMGLYICHNRNIIHRDIKGANLLINREGKLKLADFGLARKMKDDSRHTAPVVTLWYRAPELLLGTKTYNAAIDMWSVGCLLVELYTHKPLFPGTVEIEQISLIFDICGTPADDNWPEGRELPAYKEMKPAAYRPRILRSHVQKLARSKGVAITNQALDLIDALLSLDPNKRPTADKALDFHYFFCKPQLSIEDLPKYEGSHNELSSKRARGYEEQPPPKRHRPNDHPPPNYNRDHRDYRDNRDYRPRRDGPPPYSSRGHTQRRDTRPFGRRNPEYVPRPQHGRYSNRPPPSRPYDDSPSRRNRSQGTEQASSRGRTTSTHAEVPHDYREHGLGQHATPDKT